MVTSVSYTDQYIELYMSSNYNSIHYTTRLPFNTSGPLYIFYRLSYGNNDELNNPTSLPLLIKAVLSMPLAVQRQKASKSIKIKQK